MDRESSPGGLQNGSPISVKRRMRVCLEERGSTRKSGHPSLELEFNTSYKLTKVVIMTSKLSQICIRSPLPQGCTFP